MHLLNWKTMSIALFGPVTWVFGVLVLGCNPAAGAEAGPAIAVKLTRRFEVKDHRGRLCPDGKTLIVERWDSTGKIRVLDAQTGKELSALEKEPRMFELSPNGKVLTTLFGEFRAWYKPPKGQKEFKGEARYYEEMIVWDLANPRVPKQQLTIPDATKCVFCADGRWLLALCQEPNLPVRWELWGLDKGKRLARFPIKQAGEYWPAFSPDGALLAIPDPDAVRLYDLPSGQERKVLNHKCSRPVYEVNCVLFARGNANTRMVFAPDGKTLAIGGDDGKVRLWDVATGKLAATLDGHSQRHTYVRYSSDGKRLLTGSIGTTEVLRVAPGLPGRPTVTGTATIIDRTAGDVVLWDAQTLAKQRTLPIACPVSLAWSPDGKVLAAGNQSGYALAKPILLQLWDANGGTLLSTLDTFEGAQFAEDGKTVLTDFTRVVVWDMEIVPARREGSRFDRPHFGIRLSV